MSRIWVKEERVLPPPVRQNSAILNVGANGAGFVDLTAEILAWLDRIGAREGLLTVFIRHTSASLTIQENADPDVLSDLAAALDRLAPEAAAWRHVSEGRDDMPGHVKTAITDTSLSIPVLDGTLALGTWQAVYLIEHRARPHQREVVLHFVG
jgi:secondary thiamine-phosphate synthase enzyme